METWLTKIARAATINASNQFVGTNSLNIPKTNLPKAPNMAGMRPDLPTTGPGNSSPIGVLPAAELSKNTASTLAQETITHGDHQNKQNTNPLMPGMIGSMG